MTNGQSRDARKYSNDSRLTFELVVILGGRSGRHGDQLAGKSSDFMAGLPQWGPPKLIPSLFLIYDESMRTPTGLLIVHVGGPMTP